MFQEQLDLPWHTSSLKDTSLQLISWNLSASRRKVLWVTSFLWEGIIQAKSLLTDIFTPEFFQLSIHTDCFPFFHRRSACGKLCTFIHFFFRFFSLFIFSWKKKKKSKKSTFNVDVTALDAKVFTLPAEQMESYNASRANFPHRAVHLPSFIKASRFSINDSYIDMLASKTFPHYPSSVGNCPLHSLHQVLSSVVTTMEKFAVIGMGADLLLAPLSGSLSPPVPLLQFTSFRWKLEQVWRRWVRLQAYQSIFFPTWKKRNHPGTLLYPTTALPGPRLNTSGWPHPASPLQEVLFCHLLLTMMCLGV